jgi:hypothetical protein
LLNGRCGSSDLPKFLDFWLLQQCPEFRTLDAALVSKVPASRTERVSPCRLNLYVSVVGAHGLQSEFG